MGRWGWVWLTAWVAVSAGWCASAGRELGPSFDEPFYIRAGLNSWRVMSQRQLANSGTQPLPAMVATFPLYLHEKTGGDPIDPQADLHAWLPTARLASLIFWAALLTAGYLAGRLWAGETAGWLAVAFLAVEPVLLGHASLATTDIPFSACLACLVVGFKAGRDAGWLRRVAVPAVLCGLTFLAKASAVVFIPVCLAVVEAEHRWPGWRRGEGIPWRRSILDVATIALGGVGVALALCPQAVRAAWFQIQHNALGHGTVYLLGEASETGFWYYFFAAYAIKVSVPLLVLSAAILITRPRCLLNGPFLAAVALLLLSPTYRVQLGVRLILPVIALALIGLGIAAARWLAATHSPWARRIGWGVIVLCLAWTGARAVTVWPSGLRYTNELFGGTAGGYQVLSESNYDWGQGLPELARWATAHDATPLEVWYYGTDPAAEAAPFRRVDPTVAASVQDLRKLVRGRYLAASTSHVYGYPSAGGDLLRGMDPVDRTSTYLIYDLGESAAKAP